MAEQNPAQTIFTFAQVPTVEPFLVLSRSGKAFGLSIASSTGAILIVHVDRPGNPFFMAPGSRRVLPERFKTLFLQRPTTPIAVPADASRNYIIDISERAEDIVYGPLPAKLAGTASDAPNVTRQSLGNAVSPALQLIGSNPNRTGVRISNQGASSLVYGYSNAVTFSSGANLGRLLGPGNATDILPVTAAIFAVGQVAGPIDVVIEEFTS